MVSGKCRCGVAFPPEEPLGNFHKAPDLILPTVRRCLGRLLPELLFRSLSGSGGVAGWVL